jgi:hypothetical protein
MMNSRLLNQKTVVKMNIARSTILFLLFIGLSTVLSAQTTYTINADSVKLTGSNSSELIIENHTKSVPGFLYNTGNGRTIFKKGLVKINDSIYIIGGDTLKYNAWVQNGNKFGTTGILGTLDNNHLDLYTNNTAKARLTNTGNLLVGTTTDNSNRLHLNGNAWLDSAFRIAWGNRQLTLGESAVSAYEGIAIGFNASAMYAGAMAIGKNTVAGAQNVIHIGYYPNQLSETVANTVRIGINYQDYLRIHDRSTAVGVLAAGNTNIEGGTAIGYATSASGAYSIALGVFSVAENPGDFVAGCGNFIGGEKPITNVYFGSGKDRNIAGTKYAGAGISYTINGAGAYGTDNTGGNVTIGGGKGTGAGSPGSVIFSTSSAATSGSTLQSLSERARFSGTNGYFGLGTTSPSAQLHTTGTVRFAGLTNDDAQTRILVSDANGNLYYRNASSLAGSEILRSSLAVNGPIKAKSLTLSQAGWPDYVFDSTYRLSSLKEVEDYIRLNNHLPGIPSAREVVRDGVSVGETQAALLKKIEELTLYTIDQDKKMAAQEDEFKSLRQEILELKKLIPAKPAK